MTSAAGPADRPALLRLDSAVGRGVVAATVLGSSITLLDSTVVNVALHTIGEDLQADLAGLQWITNGYLLALAALVLLGGSLGDRYGRRRIFVTGTVVFAVASLACGLAPNIEALIMARIMQGIGGALLTPGSLAILQAVFVPADRGRAIGAWSGLGGIATALGPLIGGLILDHVSWRWIFLINVPLAVLCVVLAYRFVPETHSGSRDHRFDGWGAALAALALAGVTWALIESSSAAAWPVAALGLVAGGLFMWREKRAAYPMMPLGLFTASGGRGRVFSGANLMTLVVYAALGAVLFFLVLALQTVAGWSPLWAGMATLPITICMLFLAARGGALGTKIGPRIPMTLGPLLMAAGTLWLLRVDQQTNYWLDVLPGLTVFGLGLALMVAPLTAAVLAAAPAEHSGVASGINNAVARSGSLLAVAALPLLVGLSGRDYADAGAFLSGYRESIWWNAGLLVAGAAISWLLIPPGPIRESPPTY